MNQGADRDGDLIDRAVELLMRRRGTTELEARKVIRRLAEERLCRATDVARGIVEARDEDDDEE